MNCQYRGLKSNYKTFFICAICQPNPYLHCPKAFAYLADIRKEPRERGKSRGKKGDIMKSRLFLLSGWKCYLSFLYHPLVWSSRFPEYHFCTPFRWSQQKATYAGTNVRYWLDPSKANLIHRKSEKIILPETSGKWGEGYGTSRRLENLYLNMNASSIKPHRKLCRSWNLPWPFPRKENSCKYTPSSLAFACTLLEVQLLPWLFPRPSKNEINQRKLLRIYIYP